MYLDGPDKETVIEFLAKNRKRLKDLDQLKLLKKQCDSALKDNGMEFHDDINTQFVSICKTIVAADISKNTGLSADGINFILDCMGIDKFKEFIFGKKRGPRMAQHKKSTTKKSGNGSQRKQK